MIEPEISFISLKENMEIAVDLLKYVVRYILEKPKKK